MWRIRPVVKHCVNFQNIITRVIWKCALFTSNDDSNFRKKCSFGLKSCFYQKTTNKLSWKLSKVKLWLEANMQNCAYRKPLNLTCFIFFIKRSEKRFEVIEKFQKIDLWKKLGRVMTRSLIAQTILKRVFRTG